jgi:hypothetical protein
MTLWAPISSESTAADAPCAFRAVARLSSTGARTAESPVSKGATP